MFQDRRDAGRQLADELADRDYADPVVIAIPRGGVPLGVEVADALNAPLDLVVPRKIGAPNNPEYAIGAVTEDGSVVLNEAAVRRTGATEEYIERAGEEERREIERRLKEYRGDRKPVPIEGKTAIVVDDGVATGTTLKAAVKSIRSRNPARIVIAVPVGAKSSIAEFEELADYVVCLEVPRFFRAVGQHYQSFPQTSDEEVRRLMKGHRG
ncbi:MAG: Amidophosphoribosyltransferase [Methanonatronarchaeales archaeon]|nr:Amidophosphoribosyltransferase [Methanonatronarchaeales archaeon]